MNVGLVFMAVIWLAILQIESPLWTLIAILAVVVLVGLRGKRR